MATSLQRRKGVNKQEKPKKSTTTRMSLFDHFRNDDDDDDHVHGHGNHNSMKRRAARFLFPTKLKRVGLRMISSVFSKKKKTAESCCFSEDGSEIGEVHSMESNENGKTSGTAESQQQTSLAIKVPASKVQFSFKSVFNKKSVDSGFGFLRGKGNSRDCSSTSENGFGKAAGKLQRVSSRIAVQRLKTGTGKSLTKKNGGGGGGGGGVGEELCKKRILMGERCRPLNVSGTLHYDEDGILLPDVIP
ncbi:hypothetical protein JRO89_XS03G0327600 [Xanthoceras sorbifolium]|uniref:Uncharacterized protein n=1 Tax=Xanthoceras sorbifolium TaxID=99658 RepID=A0ABQ8IDZ1_9ROSI|nr:hypothetical protein JRO89_XS03G0327600 [Xanthoceras sorbifolium]